MKKMMITEQQKINIGRFSMITMLIVAVGLLIGLQSCSDDDPVPENEEELITTLTMTFTNIENANDVVIAQFRDVDGAGGQDPVFLHPTLSANSTYDAEIVLLNESVDPGENITTEVEEEGIEHQFFFGSSNSGLLQFAYLDEDTEGNPVGIATRWITSEAGTGSLVVILRHKPDKNASGAASGDPTNAGGETDIEVTFDLTVE